LPLEKRGGEKVEVEFVSNVYRELHEDVVQCNIRDITERSRLQRLTQEQATALADLDRRKDEFLAMLSHELRNPLAPILNAALLLRMQSNRNRLQGVENPILQQSATIIERQVGQLTTIVDELLEVSRITTGRIQLHQDTIALSVVVENSVATVRSLFDQRKHKLTMSMPAQSVWVHADAARLEQVVVNLLTNAAKYTDPGGSVWVTLRQDGDDALLSVRDTGVGITPEVLPRIFDLFTQAERSLDRSQGGLGIGLALVQRLVEMHGGAVTVSSTLGEGSEFVMRLPAVSAPSSQAPPYPTPVAQPAGSSLRVLVVDDNVDTVTTLALLVKESGHDVRTVFDGPSVLESALDYRPNVVLLDIGLPGLNGFDVAKQLRQQPALKSAVLVAMTGYGGVRDFQHSFEAGFDHHLVKPGDFAKLLQILKFASELPTQ
jgi:signal transduction histidine kinase/ActR/RegA family two-component response regulator